MKLILIILLISYTMSVLIRHQHPNSMKKTIDYTKSGANWPGVCKSGARQSPIAIDKFNKIETDILNVQYGKSEGKMNWNGSFFKIDVDDANSKITFTDNKKKPAADIVYVLKRVIFRTPPEHIVEGKMHDLEIQLIHESENKKETNNLLIVSILGKVTNEKKMYDDWWKNIEFDSKVKSSLEGINNAMFILKEYVFYEGSQTVPNCVENVNWIVFKKPLLMDRHILNSFKKPFCDIEFDMSCRSFGIML